MTTQVGVNVPARPARTFKRNYVLTATDTQIGLLEVVLNALNMEFDMRTNLIVLNEEHNEYLAGWHAKTVREMLSSALQRRGYDLVVPNGSPDSTNTTGLEMLLDLGMGTIAMGQDWEVDEGELSVAMKDGNYSSWLRPAPQK